MPQQRVLVDSRNALALGRLTQQVADRQLLQACFRRMPHAQIVRVLDKLREMRRGRYSRSSDMPEPLVTIFLQVALIVAMKWLLFR